MATKNRPFSGARAKIFFDGNKQAGWATGVSGTQTIRNVDVEVLGDIDPQEIEPVGRSVSFSFDRVFIIDKALEHMGIWPEGDTVEIVNFPEMTVEVYDAVGDRPIYRITGAKAETRSWRVDRGGVMTEQASYRAKKLIPIKVAA